MSTTPHDNKVPKSDEHDEDTEQRDSKLADSPHALPEGKIEGVDAEFERAVRHVFAKHGGAFKRLAE